MPKIITKNKGLLAVLLLLGYVGSYAVLLGSRKDAIFALTDHGCLKKTREVPALRSAWLERSPFRGFLTVVYWPVNALLLSQTEWKHE
jgi:hypothetical protein